MLRKIIPYSRQSISVSDIKEVVKVLSSDYLTQGPKILEFEENLANYCGSKYAVTFNSGTAALHAAYFALGLSQGDEFITTPMTFAATSNAGLYLGAKPVFVDIEPDTGNIDVSKIEKKITNKTKLIAPVHFGGQPVNLKKIQTLAKKYKLFVVEDGCHALGAKYRNTKIGSCSYSDMTAFSFHPVKHITTGEGGAVTTNNKNFYQRLLIFRSHGITKEKLVTPSPGGWYYEMQYLGFNYRITDIQAALGISQLKRIDKFVNSRRKIANLYHKLLKNNPYFNLPVEKDYVTSAYHIYPLRLKDKYKSKKRAIFDQLRNTGIGVQVHYIPVYLHPYYQKLGYKKGLCPEAEDFYLRELSIPLFPDLSQKEIDKVIKTLFNIFKKYDN